MVVSVFCMKSLIYQRPDGMTDGCPCRRGILFQIKKRIKTGCRELMPVKNIIHGLMYKIQKRPVMERRHQTGEKSTPIIKANAILPDVCMFSKRCWLLHLISLRNHQSQSFHRALPDHTRFSQLLNSSWAVRTCNILFLRVLRVFLSSFQEVLHE